MDPWTNLFSTFASPLISYDAYLDPGSGSFILQIILASIVGAFFIVKSYWQKIKGFFSSRFTKGKDSDET